MRHVGPSRQHATDMSRVDGIHPFIYKFIGELNKLMLKCNTKMVLFEDEIANEEEERRREGESE